jgi:hypothetical protein
VARHLRIDLLGNTESWRVHDRRRDHQNIHIGVVPRLGQALVHTPRLDIHRRLDFTFPPHGRVCLVGLATDRVRPRRGSVGVLRGSACPESRLVHSVLRVPLGRLGLDRDRRPLDRRPDDRNHLLSRQPARWAAARALLAVVIVRHCTQCVGLAAQHGMRGRQTANPKPSLESDAFSRTPQHTRAWSRVGDRAVLPSLNHDSNLLIESVEIDGFRENGYTLIEVPRASRQRGFPMVP